MIGNSAPPPGGELGSQTTSDNSGKRALFIKGGAVSIALGISAVAYLVAYAVLARGAGLAAIGLWGLIAAFFQYGRTIDFGASASVLSVVPPLLERNERGKAARHIDQAFALSGIAGGVAASVVGAGLYVYTRAILTPVQIDELEVDAVLAVNTFALVLMSQGSVLHAAIDAHGRAELRSLIVLSGSVIFAILTIALAQPLSILGLAIAQLVQWLVMWVVSRILLRRLNSEWRLWPHAPRLGEMRAIARSGWRFQAAALIAAAFDPIAKAMAVSFGGLSFSGTFEVLLRIIGGGRTIFANGFQVLSPAFAQLDGPARADLLAAGLALALRIAFLFAVIFLAWTPLVAGLVTGSGPGPLLPVALFVVAWAINLLSAPSYFAAIGLGLGSLNLRAHLIMAVSLGLLGPVLGFAGGGTGVIAAYAAAIVAGSLYSTLAVSARYAVRTGAVAGQFRRVEAAGIALALAGSLASALLAPSLVSIALGVAGSIIAVLATMGNYLRDGWRALRQSRAGLRQG